MRQASRVSLLPRPRTVSRTCCTVLLPSPVDNLSVYKRETDGVMLPLWCGVVVGLIVVATLYVLACAISNWFGRP